jgi:ribonuclease J
MAGELVFAPLGGVGEIGMNLAIYGLGDQRRRTWLVVDVGVSFASEENLPGIDLIFPDIRYLVEERRNIAGIVLTHAHEDHYGAMLDLWPKLKVPVYATPFTAALLEAKRQGEYGVPEIPITKIALGSRFNVGPFDIELVSVAHSIPESNALILRTLHGNVLHTGDWKLDPTPVLGPPTDEAKLRALGAEGLPRADRRFHQCRSRGRSPSESDVAKDPDRADREGAPARGGDDLRLQRRAHQGRRHSGAASRTRDRRGRAAPWTASSRLRARPAISKACSRFTALDVYGHLPPDKVVALCTGSQGEPRAALARIAQDEHPEVALSKGDRVIFSSRPIPGNEKAIGRIINGSDRPGRRGHHRPHASGASCPAIRARRSSEDMIGWVKPRTVIPVHGESLHLSEHAALARRLGARTQMIRNGDLVRLAPAIPRSSTRSRPGASTRTARC